MRLLIAVIIVLGVSNMLIMNVLERTGEIGTLMALGNRRRAVISLFLTESFYLGLIGGVIGVILALGSASLISWIGVPMPPPPGRTVGYVGAILVTWPNPVVRVRRHVGHDCPCGALSGAQGIALRDRRRAPAQPMSVSTRRAR